MRLYVLTFSPNAPASPLISLHLDLWHALRSHHASSLSATSLAVQRFPTSIIRLQKASLAFSSPPEHAMNILCARTSLLYPRRYAW